MFYLYLTKTSFLIYIVLKKTLSKKKIDSFIISGEQTVGV